MVITMEEKRLNELLEKMDWYIPRPIQNEAIKILIAEGDEDDFGKLLPVGYNACLDKGTLNNIVYVLKKVGYPLNRKSVTGLLFLLMDVNWPGARQAVDVLLDMDQTFLIPHLEKAIHMAYAEKDDLWLYGLKNVVDQGKFPESVFSDHDTIACFDMIDDD